MKIAIKIALIWLSIFDKHRLLFKTIKPLNKYFRWFLYVSTNIAFYFFISFLTKISTNYIINYNFSPFVEETMISLLMFFKILGIVLMFGFPICNILQLLIHTILNLAFILIHLKKFFNSLCYIPNDLTRIFSFPYRFSRSNNKFSSPETI